MTDSPIDKVRRLVSAYQAKPNTSLAHDIADAAPVLIRIIEHAPADASQAVVDPTEDLLAAAEIAGGRAAKLAARIRSQIAELKPLHEQAQKERGLRELVDRLAVDLEQARAELRSATRSTPAQAHRPLTTRPSAAVVRAWAERNNVPCKPNGIVPGRVYDAYVAAGGRDG